MMWAYLTVLLCLQYITYLPQGMNQTRLWMCRMSLVHYYYFTYEHTHFSSTYHKLLIYMHRLYFLIKVQLCILRKGLRGRLHKREITGSIVEQKCENCASILIQSIINHLMKILFLLEVSRGRQECKVSSNHIIRAGVKPQQMLVIREFWTFILVIGLDYRFLQFQGQFLSHFVTLLGKCHQMSAFVCFEISPWFWYPPNENKRTMTRLREVFR